MSITESIHFTKVKKHIKTDIGNLYFFETYVVAEIYEGVRIDLESFKETHNAIQSYFGNSKYAMVSNRINSYCLNITDAPYFNELFKNLKAHAVVTYNSFTEMSFELENHFFDFKRQLFSTVIEAISWVEYELKTINHLH